MAAWDVHRAKLFGRCEKKSGIAPTDRLMSEVMSQEPYKSILVPTPIHASWLNQIEIYFSIVQRKVLTPNDFSSLTHLEQCLKDLRLRYE